MKINANSKIFLVFFLLFFLTAVVSALYFKNVNHFISTSTKAQKSYKILNQLEVLVSLLKDAETGQRGYFITSEEEFLEPYETAIERIPPTLNKLEALFSDSPAYQKNLVALKQLIDTRLERLAVGVKMVKMGEQRAAAEMVSTAVGKSLMDSIRKEVRKKEQQEEATLTQLLIEESTASGKTSSGVVIGVLFFFIVLIAVLIKVLKDFRKNKQLKTELFEKAHFINSLTEASPSIIALYDYQEKRNIYVNREIFSVIGYSQEEIKELGDRLLEELIHPDDLPIHKESYKRLANGERIVPVVYRIRTLDGSWKWLQSWRTVFKTGKDGKPAQVLSASIEITEQIKAQQALKYKTKLLEGILRHLPVMVTVINKQGIIEDADGKILKLLDIEPSQLRGINTLEAYPQTAAYIKESLEGKSVVFIGQTKGRHVLNHYFYDHDLNASVGFSLDITEQKMIEEQLVKANGELDQALKELRQTEEQLLKNNEQLEIKILERTHELLESKEKLQEAQRISGMGNWEYDKHTGKITWSEEVFNIMGLDPSLEEPSLEELFKYYPNRKELAVLIDKTLTQGTSFQIDTPFTRKEGELKYMQSIGRAVQDEKGEFVKLYGTITDITARKELELKLEAQRAMLHNLFTQLPAVVAVLDSKDFVYSFINPAYGQLFPKRNLLGKPLLEALPEIKDQGIKEIIDRVYETGESFIANEFLVRLDKSDKGVLEDVYFNLMYQAMADAKGVVTGIIAFGVDVTQMVLAKKALEGSAIALEQKNRELVEINKLLDTFVHTVAHDLKGPVNNMKSILSFALGEGGEKRESIVNLLPSAVEKLEKTINSLTEVLQVQSENGLPLREVNLFDLLEGLKEDFKEQIEKCKATIKLDFSKGDSIVYIGSYIHSIFQNLISNSLKYCSSKRDPFISIKTESANEGLTVVYRDNGIGIDMEKDGKRLFKVFERLTTQAEGKGIGLHLVKTMIEKNGGNIEVESKPDEGTTFTLYFKAYAHANESAISSSHS